MITKLGLVIIYVFSHCFKRLLCDSLKTNLCSVIIYYVVSAKRRWFVQQNWHGSGVKEILVGMVYGEDRNYKRQVL